MVFEVALQPKFWPCTQASALNCFNSLHVVSGTVDGKGVTGEKEFHMDPSVYALYIKSGWHTMACATPIEQFMDGRELHGGKVERKSRCVIS